MNPNNVKYKTSMCRHLMEKGYCSMNIKCHFAHSRQELRSSTDPLPEDINEQLRPLSIFKIQLCKVIILLLSTLRRDTVRTELIALMLMVRKTYAV